jgi:hypothetical protein
VRDGNIAVVDAGVEVSFGIDVESLMPKVDED